MKNTKPLTGFLLSLTTELINRLFGAIVVSLREQGVVFGGSVSVDCCFLHVYGKTYNEAKRGYSGQLKGTATGYKLWVALSVESRMPVAFHLGSGNQGDQAYFKEMVSQAQERLGQGKLQYVYADRGFCCRELFHWLHRVARVKFIIRMKGGQSHAYIQNVVDSFTEKDYRRIGHHTKYARHLFEEEDGTSYRLFVGYSRGYKNPLMLLTNDLFLEWRGVKRRYLSRWSVETFFSQEKGSFALGKFTGTKWNQVQGDVFCSLVACLLLKAWQRLLGLRYRGYSPKELVDRILLHGFSHPLEHCFRPSVRKQCALSQALFRITLRLEQWEKLPMNLRFQGCLPAGSPASSMPCLRL
jgi:hypothetical protein